MDFLRDDGLHLAIFAAAMSYLSTVVDATQQQFTYLGCHDRTGLLRIG